MIYKLRQGKNVFELNDGLNVVPEFEKLEPRQMMFVCLVCDPSKDSPIRTLSGRHRREAAARLSGYKNEPGGNRLDKNARLAVTGKNKNIEDAITRFQELHYDERTAAMEALRKQIHEYREIIASDKTTVLKDRRGNPVLDESGEPQKTTDYKMLEFSMKVAVQIPNLIEALEKMEANQGTTDTDPDWVGEDLTPSDLEYLDNEETDDVVPMIEVQAAKTERANEEKY